MNEENNNKTLFGRNLYKVKVNNSLSKDYYLIKANENKDKIIASNTVNNCNK